MTININSLTGTFNAKPYNKKSQTSSKEIYQSEPKLTKNLDVSEEKLGFTKTAELDKVKLPGDYKVEYEINQDSNEVIIRIVDSETGEVVRQIPGEEFVKFRQFTESVNHKHVDKTV